MDFRPLLLFVFIFIFSITTNSQVKKPSLMILPSDNWCIQRYFYSEFKNSGTPMKVPDYKRAFQEDQELGQVISKVGSLMVENGFPLKDAETEIRNYEKQVNIDDAISNGKGENELSRNLLDRIINSSKSDILVQIWWRINKVSNTEKEINFTIEAIDAYTAKRISASTGSAIANSSKPVSQILIEEVQNKVPLFSNQIQSHFDNLFQNGREVKLQIKVFKDWSNNLDTDFDNKPLNQVIEEWLQSNCVKSKFNISNYTENSMNVEEARIPLLDASGRGVDARSFLRNLQDYLKKQPFNIPAKLISGGLGEATLILGDK
jgi:hypothetical protein